MSVHLSRTTHDFHMCLLCFETHICRFRTAGTGAYAIRHASSHQCRDNTTPRFAASSATPERERDGEQSRRRRWEITGRRPAGLGVSVLFGHFKQAATKFERSLRHRYTAREQALPDHVKDWHPLDLLHILLALDVGESDAACGSQESHCPDNHGRELSEGICLPSLPAGVPCRGECHVP